MSQKFQIKRTSVSGRTANTTDPANTSYIDAGELAINLPDGKLFSSNGSVLFEVGANLSFISIGGGTVTANSTALKLTGNDILTFGDNTTQNTAFRVYDSTGTRIA